MARLTWPRAEVRDLSGSGVIELRRYALHPGTRETLIELFEREFVESQEAVGLRVLGTFRDVDDPESFVWFRGFADMAARGEGLQAFYGGPVWAEHKDVANGTMIDSDNVLLLRPLDKQSRLDLDEARRPAVGAPPTPRGVASVTVCPLDPSRADVFHKRFKTSIEPALRQTGADVRARFATEHSANNYPALPVREDNEFFVWLSRFPDAGARDEHLERSGLDTLVEEYLAGELETHRLEPTSRSLLPD
jgi:hypothetical protein